MPSLRTTLLRPIADNRRFRFTEVSLDNPVPMEYRRFVDAGWQPRGYIYTPHGYRLWVFTYQGYYETDNGTVVELLPDGQAFLASTKARCDRYFGPPERLPNIPATSQMYQEYFGFSPDSPMMPPRVDDGSGIIIPDAFYCDAYVSPDMKKINLRTQSAPIFATTHTDAFVTLKGLTT